ncbi:helix-turn-helix domain-containing protein [Geothrix mesophila]|uniref:helix-turn-helix domain-containing protein n=1 Tax=Geothrix mesophila TaxID=2922723 RepID=UPI001FAC74DC|nr:helix-turn-helix domain-containing protein [Geothrix sp. SG198]
MASLPLDPFTLAVVVFDRISPFHLSVPCLVFEDRPDLGIPPYRLRICGVEAGPLRTSAGFTLQAPHGVRGLAGAGTIIVPSWRDPQERPPEALLAALRKAHARGARVVGLCLGAFVLAEAGLLDGRRATTHWNWAERFARQFPRVRLNPGVLYVDEGDVVTSAGTAAGLDCCLHLLRSQCGAEVANAVARRMVVQPHRHGGQSQFIEQPVAPASGRDPFTEALAWAEGHLDHPHTVDTLATRARMSRRTFTRHFRRKTGTTVWAWLLQRRLTFAQRLLETTGHPVEHVAALAGFGSAVSLRLHFRQILKTSPTAYRRAFQGDPQSD